MSARGVGGTPLHIRHVSSTGLTGFKTWKHGKGKRVGKQVLENTQLVF